MRRILVAALALHLLLIVVLCARDTFVVVSLGHTILPNNCARFAQRGERCTDILLGQQLSRENLLRQISAAYASCSGIESGYGYFAPNIPAAVKLVFEVESSDGHVDYELPPIRGRAMEFRLASFLDLLGRVKDETVREGMIKYLTYAVWREHRDVDRIRVTLGTIDFPPSDRFANGERASYHAQHVYEFTSDAASSD